MNPGGVRQGEAQQEKEAGGRHHGRQEGLPHRIGEDRSGEVHIYMPEIQGRLQEDEGKEQRSGTRTTGQKEMGTSKKKWMRHKRGVRS